METASLDDFKALNEQLAALVEAGVPLDVGLPRSQAPLAEEVKRINATVARRVHRGETLIEALDGDEQDLPAAYRSAVQSGLQTGNMPAALDGSSGIAESFARSRMALEGALFYPLIVCTMAYLGLIGVCLFLVPTLENMYDTLQLDPSSGLRVLQALRDTLPFWVAIPPLLLAGIAIWWLRSKRQQASADAGQAGFVRWLPGMSRILFEERCARFASTMAGLLESGLPFQEALQTAGNASGDDSLREGASSLASALRDGPLPDDASPIQLRFPPFLRWAIWHSDESTGRAQALRIAARVYHDMSVRRAQRLHTFVPMAALVLLGGTVTLLYGLLLFVPVVQFIKTLSA